VEDQQFAVFKRRLREALRLLNDEPGHKGESPDRTFALRSIRRELAELNAGDLSPVDTSGHPARHALRAHQLVGNWPENDPVRIAVLEVELLYLKRLP